MAVDDNFFAMGDETALLKKNVGSGPDILLVFPIADFLTVKFLTLNWRPVASRGLWEFVLGKEGLETCDLSSK